MPAPEKHLLFTVTPIDFQIPEAVETWERRGYDVNTYTLADLRDVVDSYSSSVRKFDQVRPFFSESAWGTIPSRERSEIFNDLLDDRIVRWLHFAKKNIQVLEEKKDLLLIYEPSDLDIDKAENTWEERGYIVHRYPLGSWSTMDRIISHVRGFESVRPFFLQSAWHKMPERDRFELQVRLLIEPTVYWIHYAKIQSSNSKQLPRHRRGF